MSKRKRDRKSLAGAAIVHAALYDPEVQRSYREFAEHYGFLIAPCRPRTPAYQPRLVAE